jgi:hypothetical protein
MATHVFFDTQAASWRKLPGQEPGEVRTGQKISLRQTRGFVLQDGELCVETRRGLAGMRGVAAALVLEFLAAACAGCAFLIWDSLR